jgi:GT2 family glycosyltransferase
MSSSPAARKPSVTVIIVSYRTAKLTIAALRSVERERRNRIVDIRAIVVDNASGDLFDIEPAVAANGWSGWVRLIAAPRNGGFAYGNNLGIARACSELSPSYLYLLNPDAEVRPGGILALVDFLESHPDAAIAGGSFEHLDGTEWKYAFRFPSPFSELDDGLKLGIASRLLQRWQVPMSMGSAPQRVDWICGASMMIRPQVLAAVGGFDERYFLYFEETEFCYRARRAGFHTWYVPDSRVMHIRGQSTTITQLNRRPTRLPAYWFESRRRYLATTLGMRSAVATDCIALLANGLGWLKSRLLGRGATITPYFIRDLFRHSLLRARNRQLEAGRYEHIGILVSQAIGYTDYRASPARRCAGASRTSS